jgi:hypothetical protein
MSRRKPPARRYSKKKKLRRL